MAFDENHYKQIFESRYGAGSFDSGLKQARQVGQLKVQAQVAQKDYTARLKARQKAATHKNYQDALDYWNQNKDSLTSKGAYRTEQEYLNDPTKRQQIKDSGFKQQDFIDAMYATETNGNSRSKREYKQQHPKGALNKNLQPYDPIKDYGKSEFQITPMKNANNNQVNPNKNKTSLLGKIGEIIDRPGDAVRTGIKEATKGHSFLKGLEDGFTGKKNTSGKDVIKSLGFDASKSKIDSAIANFVARGLASEQPGMGFSTPSLSKKLNNKIGTGTLGVGTEIALDPLNLLGTGIATKSLKGLGKLSKLSKITKGAERADELLGLPAPQLRLNSPQLQLSAPRSLKPLEALMQAGKKPIGAESPIPSMPKPMSQAFAKSNLENQGVNFAQSGKYNPKARPTTKGIEKPVDPLNRGQQYWQKRYEDFTKFAKDKGYNSNNSSQESIQELWTHFAKYDEPVNIDQVVEMAYPKGYEAPPVPKAEAPKQENPLITALRNDPKINEKIKGFFPPVRPELKVSRPATLQEMFQNLRDIAPPGKPTIEPTPLQFRVQKGFNPNTPTNILNRSSVAPKGLEAISKGKVKALNIDSKSVTKPQDSHGYGLIDLKAEAKTADKALQSINDITQFQVGTKNVYELADRLPKTQGDRIRNSLDTAKENYVSHLEKSTNDLYDNIVKKLKIGKGTKESSLVQDYGEKTLAKKYLGKRGIDVSKVSEEELNIINLQQLKKTNPNNWQDIVKADKYFREKYNGLIDQVNTVRSQIYPNNAEKIVPKRTDYYHHFNELTGFEGVKNLFDTPANIDPHLEGISPNTKPNAKFQGFMQKRLNGTYKSDAVGGFLKYLKASSHSIHLDPVIKTLRSTANEIADATEGTKNANKIIEGLQDHANDFAGKTNPYDRLTQKVMSRTGMRVLNWANSRVKGNMVLGNLGSMLGQLGNVPLGIAKAKASSLPGLKDTLGQVAKEVVHGEKTAPIYKSNFIKERFSDSLFRRFDQRLIDQPKKLAVWMMETSDKAGTRFIWNSMYNKGLKRKVVDPIKYADYETRKVVAGRGIGEVPLMQKSKTGQVLAPFTLEVGNQWKVLKDMVGEKDASGIITFLVASYGLNRVIENVRGSGVSFDPIDALIDGYNRKDGNAGSKSLNAGASLLGEVVGNVPGGNLLTQMVNTDKKVPFTDVQFKQLFGERNPNRFGSGLTVGKAIDDPSYLLAPFGAAQFRKTTKGLDALRSGGAYKGDNGLIPFTGDKSQLMYPTKKGSLENLKLPLFGPSSVSPARDYYNNKQRPLSEKQTQIYHNMGDNGQNYYDNLTAERHMNTIKRKIKDVQSDKSLSETERKTELLRLMAQLQKSQN